MLEHGLLLQVLQESMESSPKRWKHLLDIIVKEIEHNISESVSLVSVNFVLRTKIKNN
jgi:hypothetical protein